jgi:FAD/FMN-containing dehydrogenase
LLCVTFSIRGGGHLQNPGFTSNNGGVVISLSNLNNITLSDDKSIATIGAGLTWLEVYKELDPQGVAVTGARMPPVGVSGSLLGGGLSFQNSEYGFSCNGVVDYEASLCLQLLLLVNENFQIVLADSRIVHANAVENSDLFWALKGGCANFGLFTFVLEVRDPSDCS